MKQLSPDIVWFHRNSTKSKVLSRIGLLIERQTDMMGPPLFRLTNDIWNEVRGEAINQFPQAPLWKSAMAAARKSLQKLFPQRSERVD